MNFGDVGMYIGGPGTPHSHLDWSFIITLFVPEVVMTRVDFRTGTVNGRDPRGTRLLGEIPKVVVPLFRYPLDRFSCYKPYITHGRWFSHDRRR